MPTIYPKGGRSPVGVGNASKLPVRPFWSLSVLARDAIATRGASGANSQFASFWPVLLGAGLSICGPCGLVLPVLRIVQADAQRSEHLPRRSAGCNAARPVSLRSDWHIVLVTASGRCIACQPVVSFGPATV